MNKESLKEYLNSRYQGWSSFLNNVIFPIFGEEDFEDGFETELLESLPERRQLAEATGIRSIKQVGMMYVGVEPLQIFDVTVNDRVMMERNRVNIQRLIRAVMDQFSCAFMLFHYEDDTRWDWRFTYCRKSGNKEETTDSKRYTFLLGPGQSCRTATDNFMALYDKRNSLEIKDIENAFNVEALSKEFFGKYKAQYEDFVNYMVAPANGMRQHFIDTDFDHTGMTADKIRDREEKPIRDYVKKLLGRIVFLHFLQKKGWLGVPAGKEWGEGDRDFMLNIFKNANESQKENFLDDILEDLFAEGLDRNRSDQGDLYDTKVEGFRNCRIPYLNGGLFERDILDKKPSHFPASYFNSLLTMLSQYNFTIDENDPNDAEVGVDPEMLGRIFENLLEDNKDKGAFYTPKEIVQYMCRESLIAYLQTDMREEDKECIRQFVTTHDASLLGELKEYIDQKLCNVKICDPAIGSGAFPMGLLRELFFCRSAIEPNIIENAANIKRHIIQNNIYGVDIERGAVDIARLRFWLSLIVDEKSPEALPNLDFKIMQGNSLLEQYKGADLSTMTEKKVGSEHSITLFDTMLDVYRKNLRDKLAEYYVCPEHDKKAQLRKDIADIVKQELIEQGIHIDFEDMDLSANSQFFLWHTWFHDVFSRPSKEGFDIVIGNPPYVEAKKLKYIASILKEKFAIYSGTADLSIYFNELGVNLLAEKGIISYITTNKFFNTGYGEKVRRQLSSQHINIILNFEQVEVFENVLVSSVIFNISKRNKIPKSIFTYEQFYKLKFQEFKRQFVERQNMFGVYPQDYLNEKEWSFSDMSQLMLKEKIEKSHLILKEVKGVKIYRGVTTGYNPAFIISNEQRDKLIAEDIKNKRVIKNMLQGRNIRKWYYSESEDNLIFTRRGTDIEDFPSIKTHLFAFYNNLKPKTPDDSSEGRKPGTYKWFEILDNTAYYLEFEKSEKIIWGLTADKWAYALDTEQYYLPSNAYILTSETISIRFILGLLNSKLLHYYFRFIGVMTAGGAYTLKAATIEVLPIAIGTKEQQKEIALKVESLLNAKAKNKQVDVSSTESEIDRLVYNLYGLSEDEIKIVEG
ncbi:Eco57I restriction-modification methylase domain-containing protein [Bacteroides eggerthii]|uniref:Eco57I restriction-modification methylase domain-containing protein n=1 Tax=Bacteroides eggerthii TaxID=28111 RepID=UPI001EF89AE3|nr:TaqI-like C-terminal specificity domain-containing protein [Bacteroides eggerthii]MCG4758276.1 Eco57I restriction-modification methylase domain-containing protein [Bacteroides eggerthii]